MERALLLNLSFALDSQKNWMNLLALYKQSINIKTRNRRTNFFILLLLEIKISCSGSFYIHRNITIRSL